MPRPSKTKITPKSSSKKSISKPVTPTRLSNPQAELTFTNFATLYLTITVQASIENGKVSEIGFACEQSPRLLHYLCSVGEKIVNKSPDEVEQMQLKEMLESFFPPAEERLLLEYAFSAWKDVISRLPTPDPLSGALQSIKFYHREFPRGTLLPDLED